MTHPSPLDPLADAIAALVWARLEERITQSQSPEFISIAAAAKRIGISKTKMHSMISSGEFPRKAIRNIGRRVLIIVAEMDRWVAAQ